MKEKINTIVFKEPNKEPVVMQIENSLEAEQRLIQGDLQQLNIEDNVCIICDEEGKLNGKEPNIEHKIYGTIVGNIFVIGKNYRTGQYVSLTEKQVEKYIKELKEMAIENACRIYDSYIEMRNKQQEEFDKLPKMVADNDEEFKIGLKELGFSEKDENEVMEVGLGVFIRQTDFMKYGKMMLRFLKEMQESLVADKTGEKFIKEMFIEEMKNNKYSETKDIRPVLCVLGLTMQTINEFDNLKHGFELAKKEYLSNCTGTEQKENEEEFE